jgi:outer membrane protein assembly factor BamA
MCGKNLSRSALRRFFFWAVLPWVALGRAETKPPSPAEFHVSGLGFFKNREVSRTMDDFVNPGKVAALSDDAIENAAFVLVSELIDSGYQEPKIRAHVTWLDGHEEKFRFDEKLDIAFPRRAGTHIVRFDVERGVKSYVAEVNFTGLRAVSAKEARRFFQPAAGIISRERSNVFAESRVSRARDALISALQVRGHAEARVATRATPLPKPAGARRVEVAVSEGPRWVVASLATETTAAADAAPPAVDLASLQEFVGAPWSEGWRQDVAVAARRLFFIAGFPDVTTRVTSIAGTAEGERKPVAVKIAITPGPSVRIGEVRFEGNARTKPSVLKRRTRRLEPGAPLNPTALEQARQRLGRLSAFESVDVATEPASGAKRDVVFQFREAAPWAASVLFGYGSYEELRGGVEVRRNNLWGRAHQDRLLAVHSLKSTRGGYTYTVPDLFGEAIDGSAQAFGLRRDETSFRREEYGGTVALRKRLGGRRGPELATGYTFEALRDRNNTLATRTAAPREVNAASVNISATLDRRDNALSPRRGYRVFLQTELAAKELGGEVDYQRVEWGAAGHFELAPDRRLHVGLAQAAVFTAGADPATAPPVNKLYYPGGDNSLRGYGEGEAAPRAPDGAFLGAKTYSLFNLELEQALTSAWSVVGFFDWLIESDRLRDYPGDVALSSVGLGVRYRTIVGPIRVEYGRNLNPRPQDSRGRWHVSVGHPF